LHGLLHALDHFDLLGFKTPDRLLGVLLDLAENLRVLKTDVRRPHIVLNALFFANLQTLLSLLVRNESLLLLLVKLDLLLLEEGLVTQLEFIVKGVTHRGSLFEHRVALHLYMLLPIVAPLQVNLLLVEDSLLTGFPPLLLLCRFLRFALAHCICELTLLVGDGDLLLQA
jgi:hypothetical protein